MNANRYMMQALEIISTWEAMDGSEKQRFCRNCVRKSIRKGRSLRPGNEIGDATNDTYIKVVEQLADADKMACNIKRRENQGFGDSLPAIVMRAANAVLQREIDQEERERIVISDMTINANGQEYSLLETLADTSDTERTATIKTTLKGLYKTLDGTGRIIFGGMIAGKSEREIAPAVGLSSVAIHKRMTKIRTTLASMV